MNRRHAIAHHEAGHACMALLLGARSARLAMDHRQGRTEVVLPKTMTDRSRVLIALAGPISMAAYLNLPLDQTLRFGCHPDFQLALDRLRQSTHAATQQRLNTAIAVTARRIYANWNGVERIARGLLQQGSLTHDVAVGCLSWDSGW